MRDSWQVYHSQHAQPPIARCGPAWLSHWRFRVQIIALISKDQRVHSFGVIWTRIDDPRSVWIMVHQKSWWIHDQSVFAESFDAPWSMIFAFGLQYKCYGNTSDMYSLTCRAIKSFDSKVALSTLYQLRLADLIYFIVLGPPRLAFATCGARSVINVLCKMW